MYIPPMTKTLTAFSSDGTITRDSLIYTAYGHRDMKYTYIDTIRQSYTYIASSYNDREAFENLCGCGFPKVNSLCTCAIGLQENTDGIGMEVTDG